MKILANMQCEWRTHTILLGALLALNIAVKCSLWIQTPQTFPDSSGYLVPALRLLDGLGYGSQENGFRTPTYPLFIAAILLPFDHTDLSTCREARVPACLGEVQHTPGSLANLRAIVVAQIILGTLTIPLVYWFTWRMSRSPWIAALCALTYPIDLSTGYWEISILTETLATFLVTLAVGLTLLAATPVRLRLLLHVALGGVLGALALCHPIFLFYASVPAAVLFWQNRSRAGAARAVTVLLVPVLLILAWSARNYFVDGYFTPSTITGYNLTQMVGPFIEQAPPPYRDLADIYLEYRAERIAARGSHAGTIFFAYRDMLAERGATWASLSRDLTAMSVQTVAQNPIGYLGVVWQSFVQFWRFGLGRQNFLLPVSFHWVNWFFDSRLQQIWAILFFLSPIGLGLAQLVSRGKTRHLVWIGFVIATVWYAALVSSAFNFGDNERYRVPVARLQYSAIILTAELLLRAVLGLRCSETSLPRKSLCPSLPSPPHKGAGAEIPPSPGGGQSEDWQSRLNHKMTFKSLGKSSSNNRLFGLFLFLFFWLTYGFCINASNLREFNLQQMGVEAIVERGHWHVEGSRVPELQPQGDVFEHNGHLYAAKQPGQFMAGAVVYFFLHRIGLTYLGNFILTAALVTWFTTGLVTAVAGVTVYHLAQALVTEHASSLWAVAVTLAFGLATTAFPYSGIAHHDAIASGYLIMAFYLVFRLASGLSSPRAKWLSLGAGLMLGLTLTTSMLPFFMVLLLGFYFLSMRQVGLLPFFLVGGLVGLAPLLIYDTINFGNPFTVPNLAGRFLDTFFHLDWDNFVSKVEFYSTFVTLYVPVFWCGLVGLIFSPYPFRREQIVLIGLNALLFGYILNIDTTGDCQFGPRYLLPAMPFTVLGLAGFSHISMWLLRRAWGWIALMVGLFSAGVNLTGALFGAMHCDLRVYAFAQYLTAAQRGEFLTLPLAPWLALPFALWGATALLLLIRRSTSSKHT